MTQGIEKCEFNPIFNDITGDRYSTVPFHSIWQAP
jgi:hypothetical protein